MPSRSSSSSNLKQFDTDSDHSSSEEANHTSPSSSPSRSSPPAATAPPRSNHNETNRTPKTKNQKKKKRRRNRKTQAQATNTADTQPQHTRHVHFGNVSVREHERCLGQDVVPLDGGWPLGISHVIVNEYQVAETVQEFEERRQEELRKRWAEIMSRHVVEPQQQEEDPASTTSTMSSSVLVPPKGDLETRQYDYAKRIHPITHGTKNPLFGPLNEDRRMQLLVRNDTSDNNNNNNEQRHSGCNGGLTQSSPNRKQQQEQRHNHRTRRRTRSNSMHNHHEQNSSFTKHNNTRRPRSNSEQYYSQQYPSQDVLHIRNELEQIRVSRTMEGSIGCTCRKLDVYLPPPDGGGKKAQHRRMNVHKVREELRKRGRLPTTQCSRAELEQLLHDLVENEPCCWGEQDCSCRRNGIACQADACSCWFESHQRKGGHSANPRAVGDKDNVHNAPQSPTVECIRARCGNNMYAVDLDAINEFRMQYCQVIDRDDKVKDNTQL